MRKPTSDTAVLSGGSRLLQTDKEVSDFLEALSNEVLLKERMLSLSQANFEKLEELVLADGSRTPAGKGSLRTSIWLR